MSAGRERDAKALSFNWEDVGERAAPERQRVGAAVKARRLGAALMVLALAIFALTYLLVRDVGPPRALSAPSGGLLLLTNARAVDTADPVSVAVTISPSSFEGISQM